MTEKKLYSIVYADPPWDYKDQNCNGAVSYRTTDVAKLSDLRVSEITEKNAVLLMWVTAPFLPEAFELIKAWGFKYKTCAFTWVKINKNNDAPICGLGRYTRSSCEWVLLATKGKPLARESNSVRQILEEAGEVFRLPREGHSAKPAEFRDRIVELFGDLPRLEMYARKAADGWDVYGDQAPGSVTIPGDIVKKKAAPPAKKTPPPAKKAPPPRK